jgi:hypothetical protein
VKSLPAFPVFFFRLWQAAGGKKRPGHRTRFLSPTLAGGKTLDSTRERRADTENTGITFTPQNPMHGCSETQLSAVGLPSSLGASKRVEETLTPLGFGPATLNSIPALIVLPPRAP